MGWLSLFIFFLSLVELKVDWKKKAQRYGEGAKRLARVKALYRGVDLDAIEPRKAEELKEQYDAAMADCPPIPDRKFVRLKSAHTRMVALSQLLDSYPGASMIELRYRLWKQRRRSHHSRAS